MTDHFADAGKPMPEALRLADHLERFRSFPDDLAAAAELRRLHTENEAKDALLRQALKALEYCRSGEDCHPTPTSEAIDALKERHRRTIMTDKLRQAALAEPARMTPAELADRLKRGEKWQLAEQPAEQEPVGVVEYLMASNDGWLSKLPPGTKLYTAPQPAKREPLTDEEIDLVLQKSPIKADYGHLYALCRAIEDAIWSKT